MEGTHFAAGPWFTVVTSADDWTEMAFIPVSDGQRDTLARVEYRVTLVEIPE